MEFRFSVEDEAFKKELRQFLESELPAGWDPGARRPEEADFELALNIRKKLANRGWLTMHWPKEYGGHNVSPVRYAIFNEEMSYWRAPGRDPFGIRLLAPVLMIYGTEEQKRMFLPPIARGEALWCQGYSEPESGSDLASLQMRAIHHEDGFLLNGSKIWTSMAHHADWIIVLARSDADAPKHRGISFFLVDMASPGISVNPIYNMVGYHDFNQVSFENVYVPRTNMVGEENRGWYVAATLLDFERSGIDYSANARRILDDLVSFVKARKHNYPDYTNDMEIVGQLAQRHMEVEAARLLAFKVAWMQGQGLVPNKEASISKVFGSETLQNVLKTAMELMGLNGQLLPGSPLASLNGAMPEMWMYGFSRTIAAGTSEIQRNIIASRGLGLPRG